MNIEFLKNNKKLKQNLSYLLILTIVILNFKNILTNGWHNVDDYFSAGLMGNGSFLELWINSFNNLFDLQGRFQPVRHFFSTLIWLFFDEKEILWLNLLLHLLVIFYVIKLQKEFKVSINQIFITTIYFICYSRLRLMEMNVVMWGGSALCSLLLIFSIYHFIQWLKNKRKFNLLISLGSYTMVVFSYEFSIPLVLIYPILTLVFNKPLQIKIYILFLIPIITYIIIILCKINSLQTGYEGTSINTNLLEIIQKFYSYLNIILPTTKIKIEYITESIIATIIASLVIYLNRNQSNKYNENAKFFFFSLSLYLLGIFVFCINQWGSIESTMPHHRYFHSLISSFLIVSLLYLISNKIIKLLLLILFLIIVFTGTTTNNYEYADIQKKDIRDLKIIAKKNINKNTKNLLISNLPYNSIGISDGNGALKIWKDFKVDYNMSNKIIDIVDNEKIIIESPVSYYSSSSNMNIFTKKTISIDDTFIIDFNNKTEIRDSYFYGDSNHNNIFRDARSLYCDEYENNWLIIKNNRKKYLEITFNEPVNEKLIFTINNKFYDYFQSNNKIYVENKSNSKYIFFNFSILDKYNKYNIESIIQSDYKQGNFIMNKNKQKIKSYEFKTEEKDIFFVKDDYLKILKNNKLQIISPEKIKIDLEINVENNNDIILEGSKKIGKDLYRIELNIGHNEFKFISDAFPIKINKPIIKNCY